MKLITLQSYTSSQFYFLSILILYLEQFKLEVHI